MDQQAERFLDDVEEYVDPVNPGTGDDDPRAPFLSNMRLDRKHEDLLMEWAFGRLRSMEDESGRSATDSNNTVV